MAKKRPNVLTILTDDQGIWALGCSGNPEIHTPHLDALAAEGIRFSSFFCASPVCSPARASLLTGRIPSQHGVHDWLRAGDGKDNPIDYLAGMKGYSEFLAEAGYACAYSGKWHLGCAFRPQKGYTKWYTHQCGGGPYYNAPMYRDGEAINEPRYVTDCITDEAIVYLDALAGGDAPWHLSVGYTAPHSPWVGNHPKDIVESYDACPFASCPDEAPHPWSLHNSVPDDARSHRRESLKGYFAAVTAMDANVGRLFQRLRELGQWEDTIIFFTSDNGYNCGHHGVWGKGNGTLPLNMYDSSVKVPTILAHPGTIPGGQVCDALLSHYDFMPTLLDYLGMDNPEAGTLPGKSFAPLLRGDDAAERGSVVVYDEYGPVRMIRNRSWKYVHRYPYGPNELYNLEDDPNERSNRIDDPACAEVLVSMKAELDGWFHQYVDPALDGAHEAVTGKGQLVLAGPAGKGAKAFADDTGRPNAPVYPPE